MILSWPDFEGKGSCACSVPLRNTPGTSREGAFPHDTPKFPGAIAVPHTGQDLRTPLLSTTTTCAAEATASGCPGLEALPGEGHFGGGRDAGCWPGDSWP